MFSFLQASVIQLTSRYFLERIALILTAPGLNSFELYAVMGITQQWCSQEPLANGCFALILAIETAEMPASLG